ncbi:MAG: CBS domain-containing protein [Chloroflexi bacterium]|nr:MAG: CBS domain-containing protein [Chloroflexota bacterium]
MNQIIPESEKRRVRDIMTKDVVTVYPETSVSEIARLMSEHDISGLPVVDEDDRVLGVVTELDMIVRNTRFKMPAFIAFLDAIIYLETPGHYRERVKHILGTTAREIMSEPAVTIGPDASIEELAELMVNRRMNPIPVVENDRLVGIVSRSDIIRLMAEGAEGE